MCSNNSSVTNTPRLKCTFFHFSLAAAGICTGHWTLLKSRWPTNCVMRPTTSKNSSSSCAVDWTLSATVPHVPQMETCVCPPTSRRSSVQLSVQPITAAQTNVCTTRTDLAPHSAFGFPFQGQTISHIKQQRWLLRPSLILEFLKSALLLFFFFYSWHLHAHIILNVLPFIQALHHSCSYVLWIIDPHFRF